jgi:membrane protease YdiL (CAAX protease family)
MTSVSILSKPSTLGLSLLLLGAGLLIGVPAYLSLPLGLTLLYRIGTSVFLLLLILLSRNREGWLPYRPVLFGFFGVSLGIGLAWVIGERPLDWLGLTTSTPQGAALAKLTSEAIPICAAILLVNWLGGNDPAYLKLRRGILASSLGLGLLSSVIILIAFIATGGLQSFLKVPTNELLSWIPWIMIFSLANGFMEELWFRGSWLSNFGGLVGTNAALHVTSWIFILWHVINYWNEPIALAIFFAVFIYIAYIYALITRKTGTLWGAILAHSIADFVFVMGAFASGVSL